MSRDRPKGIVGLTPRDPVGAVISVGIKGDRGFPVERERYHIVNPRQASDGRRHPHPLFALFNEAAPNHRQIIRGNLIHAHEEDCFEHYLKAQVLPGQKAHPNRHPACVGDGKVATRWMGPDPDNFKEIVCPNEQCEYRNGKRKACKPWMRLLFRIRWSELVGGQAPKVVMPTPMVRFTSGSWNTVANAAGFFKGIREAAQEMGLQSYSLWGYPFLMTLVEQTKPSEQSKFPVTIFTPEMDPVEFFHAQREKLRELGAPVPAKTLIEYRDDDTEAEDWDSVNVNVPSSDA